VSDTNTTSYSLVKPEVGASTDSWGLKWNQNADKLSNLLDGTTAISPNLTAGSWEISGTAITTTGAQLNHVTGVTSSLQTQLNGKSAMAGNVGIVTVGALTTGSIGSGFGAIDNGSSAITTLGTITGGTITSGGTVTGASISTAGTVTGDTLAGTTLDVSGSGDIDGGLDIGTTLKMSAGASDWTVKIVGNNLIFDYAGNNKMKLDTSGNLTVTGNVTAYGSA
jgi:hypothetical protein